MIDSDNVLLLRPSGRGAQVRSDLTIAIGLLRVTIHYLNGVSPQRFEAFCTYALRSMLSEAVHAPFRPLATAAVQNNFPRDRKSTRLNSSHISSSRITSPD